jgi:MoxR-like ATPase
VTAPVAARADSPASVDDVLALLEAGNYVASRPLATAVFVSLKLGRPLLLEGEAGVGKTEVARVLATELGRDLLRLQCYEGLDLASAAYEWNYAAQLLAIRLAEARGDAAPARDSLYTEEFLLERPLLSALRPHPGGPPVLLIDEVDRADEPFEAFLLELLAGFEMSIPELGTVRAEAPPIVVLTSNRTREVHDALRRRCFYHWVDYPDIEAERAILARRVPQASARLREQVTAAIHALRGQDLYKPPGIAETIDWAAALAALDADALTVEFVAGTIGAALKYQDDIDRVAPDALLASLGGA